jgi:dTDP-glucose 4,6-dehydratase
MKYGSRILITGGLGFIGSNFINLLSEQDTNSDRIVSAVMNCDDMTYAANARNVEGASKSLGKKYRFAKVNICEYGTMQHVFRKFKPDIVINFAAESHVDRSISKSLPFVNSNINGTRVLLDLSLELDVQKFIQISTDEVYGSMGPDDESWDEDSPLLPRSPYAASKASAEMLVRSYNITYGLPTIITRSSNNFGICQFPEKFIPVVIKKALANEPIPVYGDGKNIRDWLHVEDNCNAIWRAAISGESGDVFNIGGDNEVANIDMAKKILEMLGKSHDLIEFVKDRPGHDFRYSVDSSFAKKKLNWEPTSDFYSALFETVRWYRDNPDWWPTSQ